MMGLSRTWHSLCRVARFSVDGRSAFRKPAVPRSLPWLVVKRYDSRLGDAYGHWWIELDATESYGWWPHRRPVRVPGMLIGTRGALNGRKRRQRRGPWLDPHHGDSGDYAFHPTLVAPKSDWQVRREIRRFARRFRGRWRWSLRRPSTNCRSFQIGLFQAVGLVEGVEHLHSRGRGCPFLRPLRTVRCRAAHLARGRVVRHRLGGSCGCPPLHVPALPSFKGADE